MTYQARWRAALTPITNGASSRLIGLTRYLRRRRKGALARPLVHQSVALSLKQTLVVGERLPAERVVQALDAQSGAVRTWNPGEEKADPGSSQMLATALVALERDLEANRPDLVVLADASDAALAAALVAAKLLVKVEAVEEAVAADGMNARLISQLAAAYTASG